MGIVNKYLYDYDNPYRILAYHIVGTYRPADVMRVLTDNAFIRTMIAKEVRQQDLGGHFIDCIIENILEDKDRMDYMHALDRLSDYYYSRLDKERLRQEILAVLDTAGVEV